MTDAPGIRAYAYRYALPRSAGVPVPTLPPKAPATRRTYLLNFADLLTALGQDAIGSVLLAADAPLIVVEMAHTATTVRLRVSGGTVRQPAGQVCIALLFEGGDREDVALAQPILASSPILPGATAAMKLPAVNNPISPTSRNLRSRRPVGSVNSGAPAITPSA